FNVKGHSDGHKIKCAHQSALNIKCAHQHAAYFMLKGTLMGTFYVKGNSDEYILC
ncbi:unnamed protein product, partial [Staurois parvus]